MKLDPRIENESLIYTPFSKTHVKLGENGYFADDMMIFRDLKKCVYGKLTDRDSEMDYPYQGESDGVCRYAFYIPENSLKPAEKKYRPYTLIEFIDKFTIGRPVSFRRKDTKEYSKYLILLGYWDEPCCGKTVTYISFGSICFTLDVLFNEYEWHEINTGNWKPFGVEE